MSEKESYISNSVSSQDDMQDMTILNPFVFYDTQDGEIASSAFQIHFATNFGKENGPNKVTEVFDKYSDFYIDKKLEVDQQVVLPRLIRQRHNNK